MPKAFETLARFTRGLVTDGIGVKGALLEARDAIPLSTGSGWRVRSGKSLGLSEIATLSHGINAHAAPGLAANRGTVFGLLHAELAAGLRTYPAVIGGTSSALPIGVNGATIAGRDNIFQLEAGGAVMGEELWVPSLTGLPLRWAGSTIAEQTAGSVSGDAGGYELQISGATWPADVAGAYVWIDHPDLDDRAYRVVASSASSPNVVVIDRPLPVAAPGSGYLLSPVSWWSVKVGTFGGGVAGGDLAVVASGGYMNAGCAGQHQGRMIVGNIVTHNPLVHDPDGFAWSAVQAETDSLHGGSGEFGGAEFIHPNAIGKVAPGRGGTGLYAIVSMGSSVYFFKRGGVFVGRGFLETDGRDVGFTIDTVTLEDGLLEGTQPITTDVGIAFCGERGVWIIGDNGQLVCLTDRDGVRNEYQRLRSEGIAHLSWVGRRLIVQAQLAVSDARDQDVANTLVLHADQGVWAQQQTFRTTNIIDAGDAQLALTGLGEGAVFSGQVDWKQDLAEPDVSNPYDDPLGDLPVLAALTTHPFKLRGNVNGRVSGAVLLAKLVDDEGIDPKVALTVLLGEEGTTTAVEAGIVGGQFPETGTQTEKWYRLPVRAGSPPVDSARVRLKQTEAAKDVRIYEVGVAHVPVRRIR